MMTHTDTGGISTACQGKESSLSQLFSFLLLVSLPWLGTILQRGIYCDDFLFVTRSRNLSLAESLSDTVRMYGGLRPLGYAFMTVQYQLFGDFVLGHQLLLLCLHLVAVWCVFRFLRRFFQQTESAVFAAICFGVMPWNLQSAVWPVCGLNLMAAILMLISAEIFVVGVRGNSLRSVAASALVYATALLFYEQYLAWFGVFPLLAWACSASSSARSIVRSSAVPMVTAVAIAGFITLTAADQERQSSPVLDPVHIFNGTVHRVNKVLIEHMWLNVAGVRTYHQPVITGWTHTNYIAVSILFLICLSGLGMLTGVLRRNRVLKESDTRSHWKSFAAGIAMVLFPIVIMSLVRGREMEQRAMYPLSIGFAFLISVVWCASGVHRSLKVVISTLLYVVFSTCTITRSQEWVVAWDLEQALIRQLRAELLPGTGTVVVQGFPLRFGNALTVGNASGMNSIVRYAVERDDVMALLQEAPESGQYIRFNPDQRVNSP